MNAAIMMLKRQEVEESRRERKKLPELDTNIGKRKERKDTDERRKRMKHGVCAHVCVCMGVCVLTMR